MEYIDLAALENAKVIETPFPYLIVPNFIKPEQIDVLRSSYPKIDKGGGFPLSFLSYDGKFKQVLSEIQSPEVASLVKKKLAINLNPSLTITTVRGFCRKKDGQIHLDNKNKLATALIYFNKEWHEPGGRLRLLRSPHDLNDFATEILPINGTLLIFRNQPNAWHGHAQFEGQRRVIQLSWINSSFITKRDMLRRRISSFFKRNASKNDY